MERKVFKGGKNEGDLRWKEGEKKAIKRGKEANFSSPCKSIAFAFYKKLTDLRKGQNLGQVAGL